MEDVETREQGRARAGRHRPALWARRLRLAPALAVADQLQGSPPKPRSRAPRRRPALGIAAAMLLVPLRPKGERG